MTTTETKTNATTDTNRTADVTVDDLTLEQKVGQLFHVGFPGTEPTEELESLIHEYHVGGVIYFARNVETPEQTRELSRSLQRTAAESDLELPLFVSVDQEGGTVRRLPFYTDVLGQMAVGATGDLDAATKISRVTADHLRSVGINFNLAPVLDVNSCPANPVIGVRSFAEEPETVGEFGACTVEALQDESVLACGKHFPGHGDTATDSHAELPLIDADESRLEQVELVPFERAIEAGIDAIMTAHVAFPAITNSETKPATLSRPVLTGLLRERLGFDGLIVTDCMEMNAIAETVGTERGAVETIAAGTDAVLVSHTLERQRGAIEAVIDAVERGDLDEERIDDSVERVLSFKRARDLRFDPTTVSLDEEANRRTVRSVAHNAITLVRDEGKRIPFDVDEPLYVFAARATCGSPAEERETYVDTLTTALEERGFDLEVTALGDGVTLDGTDVLEATQILCTTADAARNPEQVDAVETLVSEGLEPVVAAVRNPYDIRELPGVGTYLTTYDPTSENLTALADVLAGDESARGRVLPSLR